MVKVFTTNKNGKIELTKDELKQLLDEAYWEGYRDNNHSWTYTTPSNWWKEPYYYTITTTSSSLDSNTTSTITYNLRDYKAAIN